MRTILKIQLTDRPAEKGYLNNDWVYIRYNGVIPLKEEDKIEFLCEYEAIVTKKEITAFPLTYEYDLVMVEGLEREIVSSLTSSLLTDKNIDDYELHYSKETIAFIKKESKKKLYKNLSVIEWDSEEEDSIFD